MQLDHHTADPCASRSTCKNTEVQCRCRALQHVNMQLSVQDNYGTPKDLKQTNYARKEALRCDAQVRRPGSTSPGSGPSESPGGSSRAKPGKQWTLRKTSGDSSPIHLNGGSMLAGSSVQQSLSAWPSSSPVWAPFANLVEPLNFPA